MRMTPTKVFGVTSLAMLIMLMAALSVFASEGNYCYKCEPQTSHLSSDQDFLDLGPNIKFIGEGRFGDLGGAAEKEVKLENGSGGLLQPGLEANFAWPNCRYVCWELRYDKYNHTLTWKVDGVTLQATSVTYTGLTDVFIRTRADQPGLKALVDGGYPSNPTIYLNGKPIYGQSKAIGSDGIIDYLWIRCCDLDKGFCLTGKVKLCWDVYSTLRSHLAFQVKVGSVEKCTSISGGAYRDSNCNCELDPADEPMCSTFKLCLPNGQGGYYCIAEQKGKTFNFVGLNENWTYFVKECTPDGFTSSCAIPGRNGTVLNPDLIQVYAQFCGCYPDQIFLNCPPNTRQCFVPVTFTVEDWAEFCCPFNGMPDDAQAPASVPVDGDLECVGNPLIPEGMVFNRFPIAFSCFRFFGEEFPNQLVLGNNVRLTITGKTSCLENLCRLFHERCEGCGPLKLSLDCPAKLDCETGGGCLAVETIALLMNIAYNDMRLMPKTPGVDLECYTLAEGPLEGKTVGQVLFIANQILAGKAPQQFGLIDCEQLVCIIRQINANYEFEDFFTSNDNGFLIPDKPFGQPLPAHCPEVKDYSSDCVVGPCVKVTKTVNPSIARVGQTVTYKFVVKNCGEEDITVQSVTDSNLGDLLAAFLAANGGSAVLTPGQSVEFTQDFMIPDTDAKAIENTVTVTALGEGDVAVDDSDTAVVGILIDNPTRQCFLPTTLTREGWAFFCNPDNGIIQGGLVYNRFPLAFKCFEFFGEPRPNELLVGNERVYIRYIGKTDCLKRLCLLLAGDCTGCGKLNFPVDCPWRLTSEGGGCLAVETITLLLNVAYNDMRLMPRTPGYNLECFTIASGPLKGKTVAEVFNIANDLLQGRPPCMFGLASCEQLVSILRQINANYEFVDFNTFNDRGFLIPNEPLTKSQPCEPYCPTVPMYCPKMPL